MYGDCRENLLEILADVIIVNPISSVYGWALPILLMHMDTQFDSSTRLSRGLLLGSNINESKKN